MAKHSVFLFFQRAGIIPSVISALCLALALTAGQAFAGGVVEADDDSYHNEVVRSKQPVILEFTASWCGWCKKIAPMMDELASELSGKVKVVKVDVDKAGATTSKFKVKSLPSFFYLEDGNVRGQAMGALPKEALLKALGVPEEHWKSAASK